jgi:uncharacterized protein (DUF2252 family)
MVRSHAHLHSLEDRILRGESLRKQMPRTAQAEWRPKQRNHKPLDLLMTQVRGRLPDLLPIKWGRMAASPFGFFRGSTSVMAADLALCGSTGYHMQMYGDAHVRNLGAYAVHDDRLVFEANDFDETCQGPWEWDVKRMATSIILAGREAGQADDACREAVLCFVSLYGKRVADYSGAPLLEVARTFVHRHLTSQPITRALMKAERSSPMSNLEKLTKLGPRGARVFNERKPVLRSVSPARAREVIASLRAYRETLSEEARHLFDRHHPVDVCFKVVGTGSVGVRDYVVLLFGNDEHDPLFLQVKEEPPSAYAPHLQGQKPVLNEGHRVVSGQRLLQAESDMLLGWTSMQGRDYLVRQLADHKSSMETEDLAGSGLHDYAQVCGEIMAKGHARAGDAAVLHGYIGTGTKFPEAVARFAVAYADQATKDHAQFLAAIRSGKLRAQRGV